MNPTSPNVLQVLGIIQSALMIKSLTLGLGKDVSLVRPSNIVPMENVRANPSRS
jgi:hypothetical protein